MKKEKETLKISHHSIEEYILSLEKYQKEIEEKELKRGKK